MILLDENTTISRLKKQVEAFRDERKWTELDSPRSLAISIALEAAELLEHFQWDNQTLVLDEVADELADVITYCLGFSITMKIDISNAVAKKLQQNAVKYPVHKLLGSNPSRTKFR